MRLAVTMDLRSELALTSAMLGQPTTDEDSTAKGPPVQSSSLA
jgi:hypothetical protein